MQRLTLEALEVLDAIDRKGSYAAAAASLYKVQSKVSYTVNKLEEDLGVELFKKEGRRSVLTPAGKLLLEQGRELLQAAERLVEHTRQVANGWESCLNIGLESVLEFSWLSPLLSEFCALQPDIEVNIYEEVLGGAWEAVIDGRVDLMIGATDMPASITGVQAEPLCDVEWHFVVSRGHPLVTLQQQSDLPLTTADIQNYRAVVVRDSSRHLPALTKRVLEKQARLVVETVEQKICAQVNGLGVGFLPSNRIANYLESGELVALDIEGYEAGLGTLYLGWRKDNKGKALKWFLDKLNKN